jgi:exopolysaccharide production protein ExoQ
MPRQVPQRLPSSRVPSLLRGGRWVVDGGYARLIAGLVWVLIIFMIIPADFNYSSFNAEGSTSGPVILITLIAVGTLAVLWRRSLAVALFSRINPFFLAFLGLATLSAAWSADPVITLKRLFRLYAIVAIGLAFVLVGWRSGRFQLTMRSVLALMLGASLVFGLVAPKLAIEQSTQVELVGAWHGLAMQKNPFGVIAALGVVFWLHAWFAKETTTVRAVLGGGISALCLILSRSSTSLLATSFAVFLLLLLFRSPTNWRRLMPYVVGLFCTVVLLYSVAVLNLIPGLDVILEPISLITGKDTTFSGRTDVWKIMNEQIVQHPLLGDGYGAFWRGAIPGTPSYEFVKRIYVYPSEAHNGYLDVVNDLGFLGGFCLLAYLFVFVRQSMRLLRINRSQGALYLSLLFLCLVGNLSESLWFSVATVNFAVMSLATLALARVLLQHDMESAFPRGNAPQVRPVTEMRRRLHRVR